MSFKTANQTALLYLLLTLSLPSFAWQISCPGTVGGMSELIQQQYNQSDIVASVEVINDLEYDGITPLKVNRVWKGEIGEIVYLNYYASNKFLFANRLEATGPLERLSFHHYTCLPYNDEEKLILAVLGPGYEPDVNRYESPYFEESTTLLVGFLFSSLVFLSLFVLKLVKHKYLIDKQP